MEDVREATEAFLDGNPDAETDLRAILAVDEDGTWTFHDVPADSGTFGELVSRGIVEKRDGDYRLADRTAVRAALGVEPEQPEASEEPAESGHLAVPLPDVSRSVVLAVGATLLLLVSIRTVFVFPNVFSGGDVVLAGNDPWFYRYWVEQLASSDLAAFSPRDLAALPGEVPTHDVLTIVLLWWASAALGGSAWTAGVVLALAPLLAAALTGICCYLITARLTGDRRAALAALALLALTPVHAYRTMLGFGDHHALDYLWLAVTLLALVTLARNWRPASDAEWRSLPGRLLRSRGRRWAVIGLGFGVAAQALAWRGAPLLLLPIGVYGLLMVLSASRAGRSPIAASLGVSAGLALASLVTASAYVGLGWLSLVRAMLPLLLLVGIASVAVIAAIIQRSAVSPRLAAGGTLAGGFLVLLAFWQFVPGFADLVARFLAYLGRTGQSGIAETQSIAAGGLGSVFGPVLLFGFIAFLGLLYAGYYAWIGWERARMDWLAVAVYILYFGALSVLQLRFAGELSVVVVVLAGVGFVHLSAVVDLIEAPDWLRPAADTAASYRSSGDGPSLALPDARTAIRIGGLLLLVVNIGFLQIPIKQGQVATDHATHETAEMIAEFDGGGSEAYPDNYVFSNIGDNRIYNYVVNGQSRSYGFAREHYLNFTRSTDPSQWYQRLRHRSGYLVLDRRSGALPRESMHRRLQERLGSRGDGVAGLAHYRALSVREDTLIFDIVSGATLVGVGPSGEPISTSVPVDAEGTDQSYERTVVPNDAGEYALTVPYPGKYTVGNRTWTVTKDSVESERPDRRLLIDDSVLKEPAYAELGRWPFDLETGPIALERIAGKHGDVRGGQIAAGDDRTALRLDGEDDYATLPDPGHETDEFTVSLWYRPAADANLTSDHPTARILSSSAPGPFAETDGYQLAVVNGALTGAAGDGESGAVVGGWDVSGRGWTHTALQYNGTHLNLYINGFQWNSKSWNGERSDVNELVVGATTARSNNFPGAIEDVHVFDEALSTNDIRVAMLN